jgi:leucyl-tRNA synthetase
MRITTYADRLIDDLDLLDWTDAIKTMQRNWIGRSFGAEVHFPSPADEITVFTTRPDTLFGASFMVLSPEHPFVDALTVDDQADAVAAYREQAAKKKDFERQDETREKTGVFTGSYATNPVNGEQIPVWIADYVLMGYGTGAIMAVPCGDQRDFEFATKFGLPIPAIQQPPDSWFEAQGIEPTLDTSQWPVAFIGDAPYVQSANDELDLDGVDNKADGIAKMNAWLEAHGAGTATINYKLRDWLFSRQRYWGEPFPILHDVQTGDVYALDESELPVELPEIADYRPQASDDPEAPPAPPLGRAAEWAAVRGYITDEGSVITVTPNKPAPAGAEVREFRRELNTMPQWAGSCWYYLRYLDSENNRSLVASEIEQYWMVPDKGDPRQSPGGVDLYVGGAEHAVLHLLYSRFWHKVLYDLGHVSTPEPFGRLVNQGYIQAYAYQDSRGAYVPASEVVNQDGRPAMDVQGEPGQQFCYQGQPVKQVYGKMGKSLKNAEAPDDICHKYGTDTLRAYEMYMGPLEASKPWSTRDIIGLHRFLQQLWRRFVAEDGSLKISEEPAEDTLRRLLHKTIKRVTVDMEALRFNTAIAAMIEMNNALKLDRLPRELAEPLVKLVSPIAPHLAEELWQRLNAANWKGSVSAEPWPAYKEELTVESEVEIPVQINGKLRSRVVLPADVASDAKTMETAAMADAKIAAELAGKTVRKVVCIPGRMVNIVAN